MATTSKSLGNGRQHAPHGVASQEAQNAARLGDSLATRGTKAGERPKVASVANVEAAKAAAAVRGTNAFGTPPIARPSPIALEGASELEGDLSPQFSPCSRVFFYPSSPPVWKSHYPFCPDW